MQFDVVVGNPPYNQGLWRRLIKQALTDLSEKFVVMVSPDGTDKTSAKYDETVQWLQQYGLQDKVECHNYFPGISTNSQIVYYVFDITREYNHAIFNKPPTATEKIVGKVLEQNHLGTLTQETPDAKNNVQLTATTTCITSITNNGPVFVEYNNIAAKIKTGIRYINQPAEYFYINRFFGINNKPGFVYTTDQPIAIYRENVFAIGNISSFTPDQFTKIYTSKLFKFILAYYRGISQSTLGWHLRLLPIVPANVTDLYAHFKLTQEEIDYVEANVK